MKQYLSSEQTTKLMDLGLPKPKNERWVFDVANESTPSIQNIVKRQDYSIGELIEMLPSALSPNNDEDREFHLMLFDDSLYWHVRYTDGDNFCYSSLAIDLIDALYDMIIVLREKGII